MAENDQILVDRISSGDTSAFQELVERYKKKVYYLAYDITGDHQEAEDISQEVIDFFLELPDQFMKSSVVSAAEAVNKNLFILLHHFFTPIRRAHLSNGLQKNYH